MTYPEPLDIACFKHPFMVPENAGYVWTGSEEVLYGSNVWVKSKSAQVIPGLPVFVKPLVALFFIQFLSFRKMKLQNRQNGPRAYKFFCSHPLFLNLFSLISEMKLQDR